MRYGLPYRWELVLWLALAFFFNQADRQIFHVVMPLIKADLRLSDVQLGLLTEHRTGRGRVYRRDQQVASSS